VSFTLRAGDRLDVEEFEKILSRHTGSKGQVEDGLSTHLPPLSEAIALYRADFLEDVYDDWALLERERLRELYLGGLERLITLRKQAGNYEQALLDAQRLVAADPLREEGHRELMRLYHLLDRSHAALEQFFTLRDLLSEELGVEPSSATTALHREIATTLEEAEAPHLPLPPSPPPLLRDLAHLPFVGRTDERATLIDSLQAALQAHGGIVLVEGDAGVGKTRLVQEGISAARWRGFQAGLGKAGARVASPPYQLVRDALAPLLTPLRVTQLAELVEPLWLSAVAPILPPIAEHLLHLPMLPPLEPHEEQRRLWEGLSRCLAALCSVAPLLLVLEDVHWADEATLAALPHLTSRFPSNRALLLLTYRPAEARQRAVVWETLSTLDRSHSPLRIPLSSFERSEAVALVRRALGVAETDARANAFAQRLQDAIGSNALFLVEALKSLLERGDLTPVAGSSGGWQLPAEDLPLSTPASVQELVGERTARLPAELQDVLEWIAVLGGQAHFPVLVRAGDADAATLLETLEELGRRGFVVETPERYDIEHDAVQEVIYQSIPAGRRRMLHQRVGTALETLVPRQVDVLAYHFRQGEQWDRALEYSRRAGDGARAVYANAEAAAYYTQALEALDQMAGPPDPGLRFDLYLAREEIYALQGKRAAQAEELRTLAMLAQRLDDPGRRAETALRRARYAEVGGDFEAIIEAARIAIDLARAAQDVHREAAGHLQHGVGHQRQGAYAAARAQFERALALARRADEEPSVPLQRVEAESLRNLSISAQYLSNYAEAGTFCQQARDIFHRIGDRQGEAEALKILGTLADYVADYETAEAYYTQALDICRQIGHRKGECDLLNNLGIACDCRGDYSGAKHHYEEALVISREIGYRQSWVVSNLGTVFSALGRYDEAQTCYEEALSISRQTGDRQSENVALANLSLVSHHLGEDREAEVYGRQALELAQELGDRYVESFTLAYLGHALAGQERWPEAAEAYCRSMTIRRELDVPNLAIESLAGLTRVSLHSGDVAGALAQAEEILSYLTAESPLAGSFHTLDGTEEPLLVYLTCYRVLSATRDPRAGEVLAVAYRLLQERAAGITDEALRRAFVEDVASHREIGAAHRRLEGRRRAFRLAHVDATVGRPLHEEEYVEVTWTIAAPEDDEIADKVERRCHRILRLLHEAAGQSAAPTIEDLAAALGVSARTIKRDLAALREAGHEAHTRGH
jgi:tetratricopeptide (TPR) repeat protein